jgi:hypothetical protein
MLCYDNTPAHMLLLVHEFLAKHEITVIPQLPYSPDLTPADFFSFLFFFFIPEVEIHPESSLISDDQTDENLLWTYVLSHRTHSRTEKKVGSSV